VDIYKSAIRPIIFSGLQPQPEWWHHQTMQVLSAWDRTSNLPPANWILQQIEKSFSIRDRRLEMTLWGVNFPNPIGLAAGFDKDGTAARVWSKLGFGFAELGTVTLQAQPGNPRPRMFRLPQDLAALNRMGFNNQGSAALAARLSEWRDKQFTDNLENSPILGINLGKSKVTALEAAPDDYLGSFRLLKELGDYFVVNVSSPNTPGLRTLQGSEQLSGILDALQQENQGVKPILVKIAPDLEWEAISEAIEVAKTYQISGMIATNTTISRDGLKTQTINLTGQPVKDEAGGISGAPLKARSTEVIRFIYQQTNGEMPIIGTGGIFTADDAWEKITAGASLLEIYTGLIYEGPWMVRRICEGLLEKLVAHNLTSLSEAIGMANQEEIELWPNIF
jgi:dihydroorotate dehydrogenase